MPEDTGDIRPGDKTGDGLGRFTPESKLLPAGRRWAKRLVILGLVAVVLAAVVYGVGFYYTRLRDLNSAVSQLENARAAFGDLANSPAGGVSADADTTDWNFKDWREFQPLLESAFSSFGDIQVMSSNLFALVNEASELQNSWVSVVLDERGGELITRLETIQGRLNELIASGERLAGRGALPFAGDYLSWQLDFTEAKQFLDQLVPWLKSPDAHRLIVFLENPSELRPGGGFVGSFAEIWLKGGSVEKIEVYDINDADREMDAKIVPPKPLQLIVKRWRAADANWFFDFRASARKTLEFLESSKKYSADGIKFDGAIGLSANALSDILGLTGPVELAQSKITLDRDNFLTEIQKQVQEGLAARLAEASGVARE
ncbi:MAG: DUF4012 domain-containing protein, partial [Patescibacteria group bacterium]